MDETDTAYLSQRIAELESKHQLQAELYDIQRSSWKRCFFFGIFCGIFLVFWLLACSVLITIIFSSKIPDLRRDQGKTNEKFKQIVSEIEDVRNLPFGYFCGYQNSFSASNSVINYDKLLYSIQSGLQGDSPGLNMNTGKFVSGFSGTWRVDFSLSSSPSRLEYIDIYLYKNGDRIPETRFHSYRSSSNSGYDYNTGGRSVLLHLDLGDEVYLRTTTMKDSANYIIFCVSLEQVNV